MSTNKRARKKANRAKARQRRQAETQRVERQERNRRYKRTGLIAAAVLALIVFTTLIRGCGSDDTSREEIFFRPTPVAPTDVEPTPLKLSSTIPDSFIPFEGASKLALAEPAVRANVYTSAPPMTIDTDKTYGAVINTDQGSIYLELFATETPETVNNFVALARDGFYDGVTFHRVLEDFMAQGGDPTGTGTSGPGYTFADEIVDTLKFDSAGKLAMANSGPATNGSQFFITFAPTAHLDGYHTIFGEVVRGKEVLDKINRVDPMNPDGTEPTVIRSIAIVES